MLDYHFIVVSFKFKYFLKACHYKMAWDGRGQFTTL